MGLSREAGWGKEALISPFLRLMFVAFLAIFLNHGEGRGTRVFLDSLLGIGLGISGVFSGFTSSNRCFLRCNKGYSFVTCDSLAITFAG